MTQEHIYAMALTQLPSINTVNAKILFDAFGSATALYENRNDLKSCIPDISPRIIEAVKGFDIAIRRAEDEMRTISNKKISVLSLNDDAYPQRMKMCADAPIVLYYCGNADLNRAKVINMVGTRNCSEYGKEMCSIFVEGMKQYYPDVLIVSGLAYGIDINSHRAALANGMDTVGVLAHGLDRIYPSVHRQTAIDMVSQGGLLSEYMFGTKPERFNFLARNRIVAGMSDACIVVQSAAKGGSLVTADIAQAYDREVFAFPGRANDEQSAGCNRLIKENKAHLITCAEDLINAMNWDVSQDKNQRPIQQELFIELTDDEQRIVDSLRNEDEKIIGAIVNDTGFSYSKVSSVMFELEMKGVVKVLGGAKYKLTRKI